ncbi:hypothetical protein GH714_026009 [Hevea brasiliensis]|uniref:Uncharacterized protein n=1 Tax=Hevea brasiliensis TaxID=3981 RepID=A0A6A6MD60_HEVBR|nr:hypothetical protein GH714_026009 [Hevea brasiliensis]
MFGGGKGMGGGGGSMLKVVGRAVTRAGVTNLQESISSSSSAISRSSQRLNSSSNNNLILSSAFGSPFGITCNVPVSANSGGPNASCWPSFAPSGSCCDDYEWVSVEGSEEDTAIVVGDDFVLGPVPSRDEVHSAVSALTQVFDAASYPQFITDKFACNVDMDVADEILSPTGKLPHTEPSIQRMVISLSTDKAVWDAVLNNEVVRSCVRPTMQFPSPSSCLGSTDVHVLILEPLNLNSLVYKAIPEFVRASLFEFLTGMFPKYKRVFKPVSSKMQKGWSLIMSLAAGKADSYLEYESITSTTESSDKTGHDSNPVLNAVKWIFENTKAKFMEAIEMIAKLMNELFKVPNDDKKTTGATGPFEENLRTSFLLSVVVLLVVVVTRAHRAGP